jgi:hypothetical protein
VNIELENKDNGLVFLSQLGFKSNNADNCWRCSIDKAEKLWKAGSYSLADLVLMDSRRVRNN